MQSSKAELQSAWEMVREEFFRTGDSARVLEARTEAVEAAVIRAHEEVLAPAFGSGLALLAVGGFGRRELFPFSDVDVLLLVDQEPHARAPRDALSAFLRTLWDSGLRLSHSVRTPSDCCEIHDGNIELTVSLLDQRLLAGGADLYRRLMEGLPRFLRGQREPVARHLCRLTRTRHARYQDTIYHMEPNIKETPGGLRDVHVIWWFHRLACAGSVVADPSEQEALSELAPARDSLSALRCFLHYRAGRDNNLLSFDAQEEMCAQPFSSPAEPAARMREYFRHAQSIYRAAVRSMERAEGPGGGLLTSFRDWRSRLSNADFTVAKERILFKAPGQLKSDPDLVLRLFQFVARHGVRLSLDAERRIAEQLPGIARWFSEPRPIWRELEELLSLPHAPLALQSMQETGVLRALFPEWSRIECLVVRDFYHRYTVDEHTLTAIRTLSELPAVQEGPRRRFAGLYSEMENPGLLAFALVFHDIGKGGGEGRHIAESRRLASLAMERAGTPAADQERVVDLIELHLDLSAVIQSRDLDDPATARFLAARIPTIELLKQLTLMTYADISAVNPSAMTPWRMEQLWRAYLVTYRELTRELDTDRIQPAAVELPAAAEFLDGFPTRYLHTHDPGEIEAHLEMERKSRETGLAIDLRRDNGTYRLVVVARDRPGLLASITGALAGFGMNILKAEAFANRHGQILDTFAFADPTRTLELNPTELDRLRVTLERVILGRTEVRHLLQNRPKPARPSRLSQIRPRVSFDSEASGTSTLIEIVAEDRPGLLYDLTSTISAAGCNIEVVLIDTEAHKAFDVFYVTKGGEKLKAEAQESLKKRLLVACEG